MAREDETRYAVELEWCKPPDKSNELLPLIVLRRRVREAATRAGISMPSLGHSPNRAAQKKA